jgi:hypothetical protein
MGADPELTDVAAVVLLVPFPAQGHVTPMLHLALALAARGVAATVAVPDFVHRRIGSCAAVAGGVSLASIPSGVPDDGGGEPPGFATIARAMEHHMPAHLERMLTQGRAACVVVDVLASWAIPVASRCGVPAVGFWPAMLASFRVVAAIPELLRQRFISDSGMHPGFQVPLFLFHLSSIRPVYIFVRSGQATPGSVTGTHMALYMHEIQIQSCIQTVLSIYTGRKDHISYSNTPSWQKKTYIRAPITTQQMYCPYFPVICSTTLSLLTCVLSIVIYALYCILPVICSIA